MLQSSDLLIFVFPIPLLGVIFFKKKNLSGISDSLPLAFETV